MIGLVKRQWPQPLVASAGLGLALTLAYVYFRLGLHLNSFPPFPTGAVLGPILIGACVASYRYPIHVRHNVKLYMATIPLYLLAVCLPPVAAGLMAAIGVMAGEISVRRQTGCFNSDIITAGVRDFIVVLVASLALHLDWVSIYPLRVGVAAILYWMIEGLTLPAIISPINGESPLQVMLAFARDMSPSEGSQYAVAILGALLVRTYPWALALLAIPAGLVYGAFKNAKEMHDTTRQMLESMADAVDLRDPSTGGHSRRVAELAGQILQAMGKRGAEADLIVSAARVHDIGKIGLPDSVLLKDGRLSAEEVTLMETHPDAGAQLLRRYREFSRGIDVVRHHHERWDGEGYPGKLKGQAIPWGARIVAVADSFDAMTSDRPYRKGMSKAVARTVLMAGRGSQWDPEAVDALMNVLDAIEPKAVPDRHPEVTEVQPVAGAA